ncbi:MAG: PAS domain-containing sensor histidine kinase [Rhodanobacteraceae bacterium]
MEGYMRSLRRLFEASTGVGVMLIDGSHTIVWANPGASTIFGARGDNLVGTGFAKIFTEEDHARNAMETELAIADVRGFSEDDRWHCRLDGSRFWANGVLIALRPDDGDDAAYGKIVRNRTEVKEQLVSLRAEATACRHRETERLVATAEAAHEIRNSLSGMAAVVALLRTGGGDAATMARLADITERQLALTKRLTEELMAFGAKGRAAPTMQIQRAALQPIVLEAVQLVGDSLGERELSVLAPATPIHCDVDAQRLSQVFSNLLRNAIKFTANTGRIWLRLTVEGATAVIRIEDNGVGIQPAMLETIFEAFTQADDDDSSVSGVGLGLTLARRTIKELGGSIQASSDGPGTGATFAIRLPLKR